MSQEAKPRDLPAEPRGSSDEAKQANAGCDTCGVHDRVPGRSTCGECTNWDWDLMSGWCQSNVLKGEGGTSMEKELYEQTMKLRVCPDCGSPEIEAQAWVYLNTLALNDLQEGAYFYCGDCDAEVSYTISGEKWLAKDPRTDRDQT